MYDNVLRLVDDPDVREPIKFLRAREVVHYQRFAEALGIAQEKADCKINFYLTNPNFDKGCKPPCPASDSCDEPQRDRVVEISVKRDDKKTHPSLYAFEVKRPY